MAEEDIGLPDELPAADAGLPDELPDADIGLPDELPAFELVSDSGSESSSYEDDDMLPCDIPCVCCQKLCTENAIVASSKRQWESADRNRHESMAKMWEHVAQSVAIMNSKNDLSLQYLYFGQPVCRTALLQLWKCSSSVLTRFRDHAIKGNSAMPADLRQARVKRVVNNYCAQNLADQFWLHMYHNSLSEHLAEGKIKDPTAPKATSSQILDLFFNDLADKTEKSAASSSSTVIKETNAGVSSSFLALQPATEEKFLPPLDWEEVSILFEHWMHQNNPDKQCSFQTVKRVYNIRWAKALKFRAESQHAKCSQCVEFKQWRRRLPAGSKEAKEVAQLYCIHIDDQDLDRVVGERISAIAAQSLCDEHASVDPNRSILDQCIDAMEQAKFKLPQTRGEDKSKDAVTKWRPQLHVTGSIQSGLQEMWYLSSATLPKNASTQCTMLADSLDHASEALFEKSKPMPCQWRIFSDNASGETKNQIVFKFVAVVVHRRGFGLGEAAQQRVGHSHNKQDRRFSVFGGVIKDCRHLPLEDVDDVAGVLTNDVAPLQGMPPHKVIHLHGAWDFAGWLDQLPVNLEGHTSTHAKKETTLCGQACPTICSTSVRVTSTSNWLSQRAPPSPPNRRTPHAHPFRRV